LLLFCAATACVDVNVILNVSKVVTEKYYFFWLRFSLSLKVCLFATDWRQEMLFGINLPTSIVSRSADPLKFSILDLDLIQTPFYVRIDDILRARSQRQGKYINHQSGARDVKSSIQLARVRSVVYDSIIM
jgi:hypothetical protein